MYTKGASRYTLCFPSGKSYHGKSITEHRVLSYHQLLKQDLDVDHSGDCHGLLPAPLQGGELTSWDGCAHSPNLSAII